MSWQMNQFVAVINLVFCLGIAWACLCRLNTDICRWHRTARARYALLMGAAITSGLQPTLWDDWPSVADTLFSGAVLAGMIINLVRWNGAHRDPT